MRLVCNLRVPGKNESFPDVEELIIEKGVNNIEIQNTLFPNLKEVVSRSNKYKSVTPYSIASESVKSNDTKED